MSTSTVYDLLLRYRMDAAQASHGADDLAKHLEHAGHSGSQLGHILGHIGAIAGSYLGIHGAYEHLVKFNSEVQNAKVSLTAMIEGGFGGPFQWAQGQAESMYNEFQRFSQLTPMTTQEMLEFGRGVAVATQQAGGGIQDIINVTEQGAIAAKALGMQSEYAAREISEMLAGNVSNRMLFVKQLAGLGGKTTEQIRAMTAAQRLDFLKTTLNSPAMKDAVGQMSTSFSGVTSTLVDKLQILMGKVGLPLFQAITKEVGRWNEWIDKNQIKIDEISRVVAQDLVHGFEIVKDVFGFIFEHSGTFLEIGKVWAMIKIGGMLGGGSSGLLGGAASLPALGTLLGTATNKLSMGQMMGPAMLAGMAGYEFGNLIGLDKVGSALGDSLAHLTGRTNEYADSLAKVLAHTDLMEENQRRELLLQGNAPGGVTRANLAGNIDTTGTALAAAKALEDAQLHSGDLDAAYKRVEKVADPSDIQAATVGQTVVIPRLIDLLQKRYDKETHDMSATQSEFAYAFAGGKMGLVAQLTDYQQQTLDLQRSQTEIFKFILGQVSKGLPIRQGDLVNILKQFTADPSGKQSKLAEKAKVNVTIHRIEVQSDDPDRFVFSMIRTFRDAAKNPSSALSSLREG